jgi:hypothetical protein
LKIPLALLLPAFIATLLASKAKVGLILLEPFASKVALKFKFAGTPIVVVPDHETAFPEATPIML